MQRTRIATITGEDIVLGAAKIQAIAMVLHELVTNAAKYGSLSAPNGACMRKLAQARPG
jgi:two-component sensor histidine kinase